MVLALAYLTCAWPAHAVERCSGAKALANGTAVTLNGKRITAMGGSGGIVADYAYIADSDRLSGIRIRKTNLASNDIGIGDEISITGTVATLNIEKYVEVTTLQKTGTYFPLDALGMNNRTAKEAASEGLFIKTWGRVTGVAADCFAITDGSGAPLVVRCGTIAMPNLNSVVRVRGVAWKNNVYMRGERADWFYGNLSYQPLPFPGKYRYVRDWLVLGPFKDASHPNDHELLDVDFIKAATGVDEFAAAPSEGDVVAGRTWTRVRSPFDILALDSAVGAADCEHSAIYAHIYLWSETISPPAYLAAGSDDWLRVWVNGGDPGNPNPQVLRHDQTICPNGRAILYGDDGPVPIMLHQGLNSVMFKVVNRTGLAALCCQFVPYSATNISGYGGYAPYTATGLGYVLSP